MTTKPLSPIWRPGTDPLTGWPVEPKMRCYKQDRVILMAGGTILGGQRPKEATAVITEAPVICHLRLGGEEMVCGYEPPDCPFYGRYPDMSKNAK